MDPVDEVDFDKWYREEHLDMLAAMPGYRRTLRYVLGPKAPLTRGEPAKFLAVHEMDELKGLGSEAGQAANQTPWTVRHVKESKVFVVRAWELVYSLGF
jgi:hypothetical protein